MLKHAAFVYVSELLLTGQDLLDQGAIGFHKDKIDDKENGGNCAQNNIENQHTHTTAAVMSVTEVCVQIVQIEGDLVGSFPIYDTQTDEHTAKEYAV